MEADEPALPRIVVPGVLPRMTAWQPVNGSWVEVPTEALVNYYVVDPATGNEWLRVKASGANAADRTVTIAPDGQATSTVAASKGRFGINVGTARAWTTTTTSPSWAGSSKRPPQAQGSCWQGSAWTCL